jgi:ABC-type polysaccharide/polyol phosphate transport system ATPase subunit
VASAAERSGPQGMHTWMRGTAGDTLAEVSPSIAADAPPAVVARGVTKSFRIPEERTHTLKERALHPFRRTRHHSFTALHGVDLEIHRGEFFGIVGRNGSGKSTLLKCLAGIYRADSGSLAIAGRLSTFIELGVGFNPDLPARDNVILNGIMMGLSPAEARNRYDSVIEFAELEEFQDLKLKNYSSGMQVRLAFAVAVQVDADVLLVDEVLAVGDAAFQQKCFDVFGDMRDAGRTIVFVTHDMSAVRRFCHRALLLERGHMELTGDPSDVAERYLELNFERQRPAAVDATPVAEQLAAQRAAIVRPDAHVGHLAEIWLEDEHGARPTNVRQGSPAVLKGHVRFVAPVENPSITLTIENEERQAIMILTSLATHDQTGTYEPGDLAFFGFWFENVLAPGRYHPIITVGGIGAIDRTERDFSFVVTGSRAAGGLVDPPSEVEIYRIPLETTRKTLA